MAGGPQQPADNVVNSFRDLLDDNICEVIGEHHFRALHDMVREAVAEQSGLILGRFEDDLRRLRQEMVERRPLEL